MIYVILLFSISLFIIIFYLNYNTKGVKEHFCPTDLTIYKSRYILWQNNKAIKMFKSYKEYIDYYNLTSMNYTKKCIFCKPLKPTKLNKNISLNAMDKSWVDVDIGPKLFNIEYFENPMSEDGIDDESENTTEPDCSCRGGDYVYDKKDKHCWNNKTGDWDNICLPKESEIQDILSEDQDRPIDVLLEKISAIKNKWLTSQPECLKRIQKADTGFYKRIVTSYSNYLKHGFKLLLNRIPDQDCEDKMSFNELTVFYKLLQNMPKCEELISMYSMSIDTTKVPTDKNTRVDLEPPSIPNVSTVSDPNNYLKYFKTIDTKLNKIESKLYKPPKSTKKTHHRFEPNGNNAQHQSSKTADYNLLSHNKKENVIKTDNNSKVKYKTDIEFKHKEPSKTIASAYGWSFIPPQFWSVPQQRPPVCIPHKNEKQKILPVLAKGAPVDALDWTQVGSILPKFEYNEVYNPDYYYPGWTTQKTANYPKFTSNTNFSSDYWNNNRATKYKAAKRI